MRLKVIALVVAGLLLGYSGYWLYLSQNVDAYLRRLATSLAQKNGVALNYDSYQVTGFPYRLVLTFQNPVLTYRNGPLFAEMAATSLEAVLQPWNLDHAILMSETSRTTLAFGTDEAVTYRLEPEVFSLSVHAGSKNALRVSVRWTQVKIASNAGPWVPSGLEDLEFHLRRPVAPAGAEGELFEPRVLDLALRASRADGGALVADVAFRGRDVPHVTRPELGAWRDAGGTLEVETLMLDGPALHVTGSGSFTLDAEFRLLGAVDVKGIAREGLVALFEAGGWMTPEEATAVRDFYGTLPPGAVSEGVEAALAVTAQDGWLSIGPVRFEPIGPVVPEGD